ncbi:MAG: hypothetical protein HY811_07940 [Planctomycetes bacterium]|nr:hypothetical protein [Planctomycetota bacterium]
MYALFSLLIGITSAIIPFWTWKLILPALIRIKGSKNKLSRIAVIFILLAKFIFLGLLIYGITRLSWLDTPHFVVGLAIGPIIITGILLTFNLAKGK